jgi:hypothetical protein
MDAIRDRRVIDATMLGQLIEQKETIAVDRRREDYVLLANTEQVILRPGDYSL